MRIVAQASSLLMPVIQARCPRCSPFLDVPAMGVVAQASGLLIPVMQARCPRYSPFLETSSTLSIALSRVSGVWRRCVPGRFTQVGEESRPTSGLDALFSAAQF